MASDIRPSVSDRSSTRVLIAVHGYEPTGWAAEVASAVLRSGHDLVHVAVVLDVPQPSFTSLLPAARRLYGGAVAAWRQAEMDRLQGFVHAAVAGLTTPPEVVYLEARRSDPGRTVAGYARLWGADVIVVGRDTRSRIWGALFGTVHERLLRYAPCAVFVAGAEDGMAGRPSSMAVSRLQVRA